MYGTIARMRLKADAEPRLRELMQEFEALEVPGYFGSAVYRMDADANEYYLVVQFADQASYQRNAESPEQDGRYRQMLECFEGEPEWHDGEIVYSA
jgi:antibiotic biosynthesis monooxygenase (ABM) superfamily enzyme